MSKLGWALAGLILAGCAGLDATTPRKIGASPTPTANSNVIAPADAHVFADPATGSATGSATPTEPPSSFAPSIARVGTLTAGKNLRFKLRYANNVARFTGAWSNTFKIEGPSDDSATAEPGFAPGPYLDLTTGATSSVSGSASIDISVSCGMNADDFLLGIPGAKTCTTHVEPKPRFSQTIKVPGSTGVKSGKKQYVFYEDIKIATSSWIPTSSNFPGVTLDESEVAVIEFFDNGRMPTSGRWAKLTFTRIDNLDVMIDFSYRAEPGYLSLE